MPVEGGAVRVRSELRTRLVSAAVLAPIVLAAELLGGPAFAVLVAVVAAMAFWEWTGITDADEPVWLRIGTLAGLVACMLSLAFAPAEWPVGIIGALALAAFAAGSFYRPSLWVGLGLAYVAVPCAALVILRQGEPYGWAAVLYILVVVWATDIAAFFAGRSLRGPKLWPRVSPNKTWSGALAGLAAAILAGGTTVWLTRSDVLTGLLLAAPLSIAAQGGDLLESAVKRRFGVKDASRVIPGHGGVLDRVDGLFGAAALAWLIAALGVGGEILTLSEGAS